MEGMASPAFLTLYEIPTYVGALGLEERLELSKRWSSPGMNGTGRAGAERASVGVYACEVR